MKWTGDDLDRALRDLAAEDPPEAAVAAVHTSVMQRVAPRASWWRWSWAPVAAAIAALVLTWWPRPAEVEPLALHVETPAPPAVAWERTPPRPAPPVPVRPRLRIEPTDTPGLVRIASGNPDVVILWSLDQSEGEE
ncbi:MAG: hypothetical protein IPM24_19320 [Bryobacterales bacterium]|nr:hypothetical protein [Bryobacterales bacterium]